MPPGGKLRHLVHLHFPGEVGDHQFKGALKALGGTPHYLERTGQTIVPGVLPGNVDRRRGNIHPHHPGDPQGGGRQTQQAGAAAHVQQAMDR